MTHITVSTAQSSTCKDYAKPEFKKHRNWLTECRLRYNN